MELINKVIINKKPIKYKRYLKIYEQLNHEERMTHYKKDGCLIVMCNNHQVITRDEMNTLHENEKEGHKNWYEIVYLPFSKFEIYEGLVDGHVAFSHENVKQ